MSVGKPLYCFLLWAETDTRDLKRENMSLICNGNNIDVVPKTSHCNYVLRYVASFPLIPVTPFPYGDSPLKRESAGECFLVCSYALTIYRLDSSHIIPYTFFSTPHRDSSSEGFGLEFRGLWTGVQTALDWNLEPVKINFRFGENIFSLW